jgi:hypothetical protein
MNENLFIWKIVGKYNKIMMALFRKLYQFHFLHFIKRKIYLFVRDAKWDLKNQFFVNDLKPIPYLPI